ncbi:response regulator transcription factor [Synechococcus sp. WC10meta]|uniref:response regulator transcription factor n=1 Tax=Synechococcus sp. WC10meta TaxID=2964537 RepID=UPI0039C28214
MDAPKRLLVVDDDPNLVLLVKDYLEFRGYEVVAASNGLEALEVMRRLIPDLIICDVMMPEMDGYTFVQTLRSDRATDWIPVIFLSARGQTADRVRGLNTGADAYLVKPFEPEELVAQVEATLKRTERLLQMQGAPVQPVIQLDREVELTPTETKVLQYVARGMSNREIAEVMGVSQRTIESHVSNMLAKTGLHNRTELARWAIESGLGRG